MLNTASVGVYPNLVRRRERLQPALGKPLAGVVASLRTFGVNSPTTLTVDGVKHKLWILYLGRGRYYPRDHAPLRRPVLDDGVLDLRMITADEPFARARLLWAVVTGTVAASKVTHLTEATAITVEAIGLSHWSWRWTASRSPASVAPPSPSNRANSRVLLPAAERLTGGHPRDYPD